MTTTTDELQPILAALGRMPYLMSALVFDGPGIHSISQIKTPEDVAAVLDQLAATLKDVSQRNDSLAQRFNYLSNDVDAMRRVLGVVAS